jgi:class 3 adenylate cyclase
VPRERPLSIAIHAGAVSLVSMTDGLHGDQGHALVPGEAVNTAASLEECAASEGWRIAASAAVARALEGQAHLGRKARTRRGDDSVEVLGLVSA